MNYEAISVWSQGLSALLFLALLIFLWMKYIEPAVLSAQESANAQIAQAERHRDEAKARRDALSEEIEHARQDAAAIKHRVQAQARTECEAIVAEARRAGERTVQNAQGELERSRSSARERLREELLDQALGLARAQAEQRVDGSVNRRLVTAFLARLEQRGSTRRSLEDHVV